MSTSSFSRPDLQWKIAVGAIIAIVFVLLLGGFKPSSGPVRETRNTVQQQQQQRTPLPTLSSAPKPQSLPSPVPPSPPPPAPREEPSPRRPEGQPKITWRSTTVDSLQLKPSSYECIDAESTYQTCMFENLVMFRGDLWFITPDESTAKATKLPDPLIFEVGNSPSNNFAIPAIINTLSSANALSFITTTLSTAKTSSSTTSTTSTTSSSSPNSQNNNKIRVAEFNKAIFQRTRTFNNWFWALNGAGNVYHRICKYFSACTAEDIHTTAVLQPIIESSRNLSEVGYVGLPHHHAVAVKDLASCFGPLLWVNHPSGREIDERPQDEVVLLKQVLVGIGEDVVQPKAALSADSEVRFKQASPEMSLRRVRYLRQCAGLSADPTPHTRPSVLLVNRPYADGRSILGLDDVADRVRRALPRDVTVRIFLPRGDAGISDQATAFDQANVVIAPHGAATANFNFLPHDAVALGVFALKGRFGHDEAVGAAMPYPAYNMTVLPVDCTEKTEARTLATAAVPQFDALAAEDKLALLMGAEMSRERAIQVHDLLGMSLLDWMDYRAYAPDPTELTTMILDAVKLWEVKVDARKKAGTTSTPSRSSP